MKNFIETINQIAAHLEGFTVESVEEGSHYVWLNHSDGRRLTIRHDYYSKRLEISGSYPLDPYGAMTSPRYAGVIKWNEKANDSITVSPERQPEAIARDIKRRLLPSYTELYEGVRRCIDRQQDNHNNAQRGIQAIATVLNVTDRVRGEKECQKQVYFHSPNGYATINTNEGKTYSFDLRSIPYPQAIQIANILKTLA